jgi:hypothetical protein
MGGGSPVRRPKRRLLAVEVLEYRYLLSGITETPPLTSPPSLVGQQVSLVASGPRRTPAANDSSVTPPIKQDRGSAKEGAGGQAGSGAATDSTAADGETSSTDTTGTPAAGTGPARQAQPTQTGGNGQVNQPPAGGAGRRTTAQPGVSPAASDAASSLANDGTDGSASQNSQADDPEDGQPDDGPDVPLVTVTPVGPTQPGEPPDQFLLANSSLVATTIALISPAIQPYEVRVPQPDEADARPAPAREKTAAAESEALPGGPLDGDPAARAAEESASVEGREKAESTNGWKPQLADLLRDAVPLDVHALEEGVKEVLNDIATFGQEIYCGASIVDLAPWVVAVGAVTGTIELARRRLRRPAPGFASAAASADVTWIWRFGLADSLRGKKR